MIAAPVPTRAEVADLCCLDATLERDVPDIYVLYGYARNLKISESAKCRKDPSPKRPFNDFECYFRIANIPLASFSCPGNAVWDGTDAVMLSGEAASGKFPCEAVMAEAAAAREAESAAWMECFVEDPRAVEWSFNTLNIFIQE